MARPRSIASRLRTSFLIPNLHCPTCVRRIEELMSELDPMPLVENISIVDHIVTVVHDKTISAKTITNKLDAAAYEVFDIILDPASSEQVSVAQSCEGQLATAIDRWTPAHAAMDESARAEHIKNCNMCAEYSSDEEVSEKKVPDIMVAAPDIPNYRATFSIEGMTCSSCVGNVTKALKGVPGVTSAEVALVSLSAAVKLQADEPNLIIEQLVDAVEDIGYGAELVEVKLVGPQENGKTNGKKSDRWQAFYSIVGMSCSSCIRNIQDAVKALDYVEHVEINLVGHSGSIIFNGKGNEHLIRSAIENAGYEAMIDKLTNLDDEECNDIRTVSLRVDGMHCHHCPQRIAATVERLNVKIDKKPELDRPVIMVSYIPRAPKLNIRTIIEAIHKIDDSFSVSVYHPQSVEERSRTMLRKERRSIMYRLIFAVVAAIPAFILGIVYMNLVPKHNPGYLYLIQPLHGATRLEWATFVIATPVYFYGADHFHRRTIKEIYALWKPRSSTPMLRRFYRFGSMNMLISLGTTIAYFSSLAQLIASASSRRTKTTMQSSGHTYFDSVVFLTMFLLCGRLIEAHMKARSGDAVAALGKLRPTEASLVLDTGDSKLGVDYIDVGDTVRIPQGSMPPCDGILLAEAAELDESSLTGESRIIRKQKGDLVYTGTINKGPSICVRVTGPAGTSLLDSIIQVVREGQAKRAPIERVADLLTAYFVPVVVLIAILTWVIWLALGLSGALPNSYLEGDDIGGWPFWSLQFAIAVFVIACPCGLGLAAPTALFVGGGMAAQRGILVKGGGEGFQEASNLDAVIFDKTGTLTEGTEPRIVEQKYFDSEFKKETILGVLKAMEETSNHPLAKAAVAFASEAVALPVHLTAADEIAGRGIKARCNELARDGEYETFVGNETFMCENGIIIPDDAASSLASWKASAYSVILLASKRGNKSQLMAIFAAADPLRKEASEVVRALQAQRVAVFMLSGDNPETAQAVGVKVGIPSENIIAGVLPAQKADKVKQLQRSLPKSQGKGMLSSLTNRRTRATIAMVGDGINDAPALAAADVGIAVASGSDVAIQSAAFILVQSDLRAVLTLVTLSRAVFRRVIENFFWAAFYNLIALPIAAGVLYPIESGGSHVRLDPAWAALAMALSSITVVGSSLLLRTRLPLVGFRSASR